MAFLVLAVACFMQGVAGYQWTNPGGASVDMLSNQDPLNQFIMDAKLNAQNINYAIQTNMMRSGNQIASVRAQFIPTMKALQDQLKTAAGACAFDTQAILSQNWQVLDGIDECRYNQLHNVIRNGHMLEIKRQINLANVAKYNCRTRPDYMNCAQQAAGSIKTDLDDLSQETMEKVRILGVDSEECIVETSSTVEKGVNEAVSGWDKCRNP